MSLKYFDFIEKNRRIGTITMSKEFYADILAEDFGKIVFDDIQVLLVEDNPDGLTFTLYSKRFRKADFPNIPQYIFNIRKCVKNDIFWDTEKETYYYVKWAEKLENGDLVYLDEEDKLFRY